MAKTGRLTELKSIYKPLLLKAQRKYRRELKKDSNRIEFKEAQRSGGQFSFRRLKTESQFFSELTRINTYLNSQLSDTETFLKSVAKRGEDYMDLFRPGMTKEERSDRILADNMGDLYEVYRRLQEEDPAAIGRNGIFESDTFIAYLYSYHVEGYSKDDLQTKGKEFLDEIRSIRREKFQSNIPVAMFNRGGR